MGEVVPRVDELAKAQAAVTHEQPAAFGVVRDQLRYVAGTHALEDGEQARLEGVGRSVGLEPEVAFARRDAEDGRPPADMRLFDLAGRLQAVLGQPRAGPGGCLLQPLGLHPDQRRVGRDGHGPEPMRRVTLPAH